MQLEAQLSEKGVSVVLSDKARDWLASEGYDKTFGARPLGRVIQEHIKKPLAEELLFGRLVDGGIVNVDFLKNKLVLKTEGPNNKDKKNTWIIDPIDGTTNFLHGIPHFAISIALKSMTGTIRMWALLQSIKNVIQNKIDGDIGECGVWKGGNLILSQKYLNFRNNKNSYEKFKYCWCRYK